MESYSKTAAIFFIIGLILGSSVLLSSKLILFLVLALVFLPIVFCTCAYFAKKKVWIISVASVFLCVGIIIQGMSVDTSKRELYAYKNKNVVLSGDIYSVPHFENNKTSFILKADSVILDNVKMPTNEKIRVTVKGEITGGGYITLKGNLTEIQKPLNQTSFNYKKYYSKRGVYFKAFADELSITHDKTSLNFFECRIIKAKLYFNSFIEKFGENSPLLKAIIQNNKSDISDEDSEAMLNTGVYRYLYCCYLHLSILLFIILKLFKDKKRRLIAVFLCVLAYLLLNTTSPSAWKLCIFICGTYFIPLFFGYTSFKTAIYLAIILTGLFSPQTVSDSGFIISLGCTILLHYFFPPIYTFLKKYLRIRFISAFFTFYIIIFVLSAPLATCLGFQINPYSILIGYVLMPVVTIIYPLFYLSLLIYSVSGYFITFGIDYLLSTFKLVSDFVQVLPMHSLYLPRLGLLFTLAFYSAIIFIYKRFFLTKKAIPLLVLSIILCIGFTAREIYLSDKAELIFINVGQSDCSLFITPGGKTILIDGGGSAEYSDYDIAKAEVLPMLSSRGINKIDYAIVSHYHKDHADGIVTILKNLQVEKIFAPNYLPNSEYRDIIENEARAQNSELIYIDNKTDFSVDDTKVCLTMLQGEAENDNCLLTSLSYGETDMLFAGDIETYTESKLNLSPIEILKVPHHGSKNSSSPKFVRQTSPEYAVICVGENNSYGHPNEDVVKRYQKQGAKLLRTDKLGDIHFIIDKASICKQYSYKGENKLWR